VPLFDLDGSLFVAYDRAKVKAPFAHCGVLAHILGCNIATDVMSHDADTNIKRQLRARRCNIWINLLGTQLSPPH